MSIVVFILAYGCSNDTILTEAEHAWLNQHPDITVSISSLSPPLEFVNEDGEVVGMFVDFLSIIEEKIDYKFKKIYYSDFQKNLDLLRTNKVDVLLEMQSTPLREKYMSFTPPLANHPHAIIVRSSQTDLKTLNDLLDRNITVVNKYAVHEYLVENHSELEITTFENDLDCLRALSTGVVDAFICQQAVATYYLEKEGISNLRITGQIDYSNQLAIASRKNLPVLHSILTKAVHSISNKDKAEIYNKWLSYNENSFNKRIKILYFILGGIALILLAVILFNFALQQKVKKRTKELNLAKIKAEESDQLKTAFLANMSHEIRTPMNGILGFTNLLKDTNLSGEKKNKYIEMIQKSGDRMLNTVNDIIEISKIETGQVKLNLEVVNLNELKKELCEFFRYEAGLKQLEFNCKICFEKELIYLKTDRAKLTSILTNLIKNAIKFTASGSIDSSYTIRDGLVEFSISDTGSGISNDRKDAIFNRFEQADIGDSKAHEGSGLGLAISKSYVEMLGGNIWMKSEEGVGSTFFFTIPFSGNNKFNYVGSDLSLADEQTHHNKLRILIAEDDDVSFMHLSILLELEGHDVVHAENGLEVLDFLNKGQLFDLILMDLKMPQLNGYQTTQKIRESNQDIVIIAQTAFALVGDREKALEVGCTDYISKPILQADLVRLLNTYF